MTAIEQPAPRDARTEVLDRIRTALAGSPLPPPVPRAYRTRGEHDPGSSELLDLLTDRLVDYKASVRRASPEQVPAVITELLALRGARRVVVPAGLPADWTGPGVDALRDNPDSPLSVAELDAVDGVVTASAVAIAETGTIVLDASPDQGRRAISLVPDLLLCVVRADQVVATVPEGIARLTPTRPLTFISGPSATSDIELNRVEGVHGPRTLDVVLVTG
ncbi:MAG: lactate utilization protein C [Actinomycetota bacterium]|jgi:L-lactate dehydrogenase complex protein LldG|nr:lactate utilization protein C [Actinomycetota bacterium]